MHWDQREECQAVWGIVQDELSDCCARIILRAAALSEPPPGTDLIKEVIGHGLMERLERILLSSAGPESVRVLMEAGDAEDARARLVRAAEMMELPSPRVLRP